MSSPFWGRASESDAHLFRSVSQRLTLPYNFRGKKGLISGFFTTLHDLYRSARKSLKYPIFSAPCLVHTSPFSGRSGSIGIAEEIPPYPKICLFPLVNAIGNRSVKGDVGSKTTSQPDSEVTLFFREWSSKLLSSEPKYE